MPGDPRQLREIFDIRLEALERLVAEQFKTSQIALVLGAKETERRLDLLNHDGQRRSEMMSTFVTREAFDSNKSIIELKIENIQRIIYTGVGAVIALQVLIKFLT